MSITTQKLLVAALSLALFAALIVAGRVDSSRRSDSSHGAPLTAATLDPQLQRGRLVFVKYSCNACHGPAGSGGIHNLNAETGGQINGLTKVSETYTTAELAEKIRTGVAVVEKADPTGPEPPLHMPAYRDLITGTEMQDLVAYLMSLGAGKPKSSSW